MNFLDSIDLIVLLFAVGLFVYFLTQKGWKNIKFDIRQAFTKLGILNSIQYWAIVIGSVVPAGVIIFIGVEFNWSEVIYMSIATGVFIFMLYFLTINQKENK